MSAPHVYKAISAVSRGLSGEGIAKCHRNERDDYRYRSIDDVLNRLSPLFAKHKLCVLPRVLDRTALDRVGDGDLLLVSVTLRIAFDLVSTVDGSSHTIEAFGEALDASDKATAKAMSSAYKHAMLQTFCVPVSQVGDADAGSHRLKRQRSHASEPVEGWQTWSHGIIDIAASCASLEALERLQDRQRPLLNAISRERPDLYTQLGAVFAKGAAALNAEQCASSAHGGGAESDIAKTVARAMASEPQPRFDRGAKSSESAFENSTKAARTRAAPSKRTERARHDPVAVPEPA